jgi:hypothetical protein
MKNRAESDPQQAATSDIIIEIYCSSSDQGIKFERGGHSDRAIGREGRGNHLFSQDEKHGHRETGPRPRLMRALLRSPLHSNTGAITIFAMVER